MLMLHHAALGVLLHSSLIHMFDVLAKTCPARCRFATEPCGVPLGNGRNMMRWLYACAALVSTALAAENPDTSCKREMPLSSSASMAPRPWTSSPSPMAM